MTSELNESTKDATKATKFTELFSFEKTKKRLEEEPKLVKYGIFSHAVGLSILSIIFFFMFSVRLSSVIQQQEFFGKEDELIYYDAGCMPGGWFEAVTGSILDTFNICFDDNFGITDCA